jgi:tripartite ATP-independent transporter DctM subunit
VGEQTVLNMVVIIMAVGFIIGLPVAFTLGVAALAYFSVFPRLSPTMIPLNIITGIQSESLMAIPLFMLAGGIMNTSGLTRRLFRFSKSLVGHFPGGTAQVNVVANLIMAGMSGSELADASAIGKVLIPSMKEEGYDSEFAAALTGAASTIGPIFPPSIPMVLIGGITGISIGKMFVGGVIPGLFMALYLMAGVYYLAKKRNYPKSERATLKELTKSFFVSIPALSAPVIIIGGMVGGIFTPNEAGVVACFYSMAIAFFVYRDLDLSKVFSELVSTAIYTSKIMFIVGCAYALAWVFSREQMGIHLTNFLTSVSTDPKIILSLMVVAFLIAGCFLNPSALIIIFIPLLMPVVKSVGIDPILFGVVTSLALMIGNMTPPFGLCMFIVCDIAKVTVKQLAVASVPFYIILILALVTMIFIPQTVTYLPNLLFK